MKDDRVYLAHLRDALQRVIDYTAAGREAFFTDPKTQDAVIRNLEIVGEAAKRVTEKAPALSPDVPWKVIAGMRDKLTALGLVLVGGALACRVGAAPPQSTTSVRDGVFDYWADAERYGLRGIVRMTADTVVLEPQSGSCRPVVAPPDQVLARYECTGHSELSRLELRIDRRSPQLSSKWQATFKVRKQRQICAKGAATDDGQRICMQYETQDYEETVTLSGPLRVRLRGATPGR